jgi:glycosyltransferase involved in cell wall biosynthesis
MHLSKHHYAFELVNQGNEVVFLEPPLLNWEFSFKPQLKITEYAKGLKVVTPKLFFPYNIKFHCEFIYYILVRNFIKRLESKFDKIDQIWSFDLMNNFPFGYFKKDVKRVYFPADFPLDSNAFKAIKGADFLISIAQEILDQYTDFNSKRKLLLNHGVSDVFIKTSQNQIQNNISHYNIGVSGNFLRPDLDKEILLKLINTFPEAMFHLFGPISLADSNIGGNNDNETIGFIKKLRSLSNVILYSVVPQTKLAEYFSEMHIFLVCYDVKKDQSKGVNYHKIMEYMAYGKPILSSYVSAYNNSDLLYMVKEIGNNEQLLDLLKKIMMNYEDHFSQHYSISQKKWANSNTYCNNVSKIQMFINDNKNETSISN